MKLKQVSECSGTDQKPPPTRKFLQWALATLAGTLAALFVLFATALLYKWNLDHQAFELLGTHQKIRGPVATQDEQAMMKLIESQLLYPPLACWLLQEIERDSIETFRRPLVGRPIRFQIDANPQFQRGYLVSQLVFTGDLGRVSTPVPDSVPLPGAHHELTLPKIPTEPGSYRVSVARKSAYITDTNPPSWIRRLAAIPPPKLLGSMLWGWRAPHPPPSTPRALYEVNNSVFFHGIRIDDDLNVRMVSEPELNQAMKQAVTLSPQTEVRRILPRATLRVRGGSDPHAQPTTDRHRIRSQFRNPRRSSRPAHGPSDRLRSGRLWSDSHLRSPHRLSGTRHLHRLRRPQTRSHRCSRERLRSNLGRNTPLPRHLHRLGAGK